MRRRFATPPPGAIWLAVLFAGVLAFNRSYQIELDGGALEQLILYPGTRRAIFAGKLLANFAFVALMLVVVVAVGGRAISGPRPRGVASVARHSCLWARSGS